MTTTKSKVRLLFLAYSISIITVLTFLCHVFIPKSSAKVDNLKRDYSVLLKTRDTEFLDLEEAYVTKNDTIASLKLLNKFINTYNKSKSKYKEYNRAKSEVKVFGFKNLNVFSFQFSVFFICFLSATTVFIFTRNREKGKLKTALKINSWTFMIIAMYYMVYCFYKKSDLPYFAYISLMIVISITLTFAYFKGISWIMDKKINQNKKVKLLNKKIKLLISFMFRTKDGHFKKVASKALYSEVHKEPKESASTVENDTNEFENDMFRTLEEVLEENVPEEEDSKKQTTKKEILKEEITK